MTGWAGMTNPAGRRLILIAAAPCSRRDRGQRLCLRAKSFPSGLPRNAKLLRDPGPTHFSCSQRINDFAEMAAMLFRSGVQRAEHLQQPFCRPIHRLEVARQRSLTAHEETTGFHAPVADVDATRSSSEFGHVTLRLSAERATECFPH